MLILSISNESLEGKYIFFKSDEWCDLAVSFCFKKKHFKTKLQFRLFDANK